SFNIGPIHLVRIAYPDAVISGHMKNNFTTLHGFAQGFRLAQITHSHFRAEVGNVVGAAGRANKQAQVRTLLSKRAGNMTADEPGGSCDECFHADFFLFMCSDIQLAKAFSSNSPAANGSITCVAAILLTSNSNPF